MDVATGWLIAIGAVTGLTGAMLGLGGGVFLVPLLALALGVPIRVAVATSLLSVIASASASATVNLSRGLVNLRLGLVLAGKNAAPRPSRGPKCPVPHRPDALMITTHLHTALRSTPWNGRGGRDVTPPTHRGKHCQCGEHR